MTPKQKILREILLWAREYDDKFTWEGELTADNIDEIYEEVIVENEAHWDYESEFRCSGIDTGLPCNWSRHYESKSVARQLSDNTWVGWTYWYGGGKHGDPGSIDWMSDAYEVKCTEEEKLVVVRTFEKTE